MKDVRTLDEVLSDIDDHSDAIHHALMALRGCARELTRFGFDIREPLLKIEDGLATMTDIWDVAYDHAHEEG